MAKHVHTHTHTLHTDLVIAIVTTLLNQEKAAEIIFFPTHFIFHSSCSYLQLESDKNNKNYTALSVDSKM